MAFIPFGQPACEFELKDYSNIYFDETPFNHLVIGPDTYLIVGRRGSGKTALARYFSFQKSIKNALCISVDEPAIYREVLSNISTHTSEMRTIAVPRLQRMWEYVIWSVIFARLREFSPVIDRACNGHSQQPNTSGLVDAIIRKVHNFLQMTEGGIDQQLSFLLNENDISEAKQEALAIARKRPVIVALDTLEQYDTSDAGLMNAIAALIQAASTFNREFSESGIHLKVLMSGEVFPHLLENVLENTTKSVRNPVYLFWRPKDLLRLICWRLFRHLETTGRLAPESKGCRAPSRSATLRGEDVAWADRISS